MKIKGSKLIVMIAGVIVIAAAICIGKALRDRSHSQAAATASPTETPVQSSTPEPTQVPVLENVILPAEGMVLAGENISFGLAQTGRVSYIGCNNGQAYCYDWENVIQLCGGEAFTAGLVSDGGVVVSGDEADFSAVKEWKHIVKIAASKTALFALDEEGRVFSTDKAMPEFAYVVDISAGDDFLIALLANGEIVGHGNVPSLECFSGKVLAELACGADFVCAVTNEGEFISSPSCEFDGEGGVVTLFAGKNCVTVIDETGKLRTSCDIIEKLELDSTAVVDVSCNGAHALVLTEDGRVVSGGDNSFMQCMTENWRLRAYITEDEYIYGIKPGSTFEGKLIKTGDRIRLENGAVGTAIILGDVDMNGEINENDLELLKSHVNGEATLSGVQLLAANVLKDGADEKRVDLSDVEQLSYHLNGFTEIDQYARTFTYSKEIAEAERINPDAVGYMDLEGTNIQQVIMYGDNFYYHTHNSAGAATSRGSVYLYYPMPVRNIVVTAHNLRRAGLMFHQLHLIQNQFAPEYGEFKNRIWTVNLFGETHYWEVFAMYEEKPAKPEESSQYYNCNYNYTMDSMSEDEIREWIAYQLERSELDYTVHVTEKDRFMTVLTCADAHWESNQGGRLYFFLRMMDGR